MDQYGLKSQVSIEAAELKYLIFLVKKFDHKVNNVSLITSQTQTYLLSKMSKKMNCFKKVIKFKNFFYSIFLKHLFYNLVYIIYKAEQEAITYIDFPICRQIQIHIYTPHRFSIILSKKIYTFLFIFSQKIIPFIMDYMDYFFCRILCFYL